MLGVAIFAPAAHHRGAKPISQGRDERHIGGDRRQPNPVGRPQIAEGTPVFPDLPSLKERGDGLIEILPPPEIEPVGGIEDVRADARPVEFPSTNPRRAEFSTSTRPSAESSGTVFGLPESRKVTLAKYSSRTRAWETSSHRTRPSVARPRRRRRAGGTSCARRRDRSRRGRRGRGRPRELACGRPTAAPATARWWRCSPDRRPA